MAENIKEIAGWLGLLGVPTIFIMISGIIQAVIGILKKINILMSAQKAQMRSQLLTQYYEYTKRGFIYSDEQREFENQYLAYHELVGENGILDTKREEILNMPSRMRN